MKKRNSGFTLIELLIVVAIIAILAAIAVPNFLEAQVRAKVARAKADMRTIATALESYSVDYNRVPIGWREAGRMGNVWWGVDPSIPDYDQWYVVYRQITTPIGYLTSVPNDVFTSKGFIGGAGQQNPQPFYVYQSVLAKATGSGTDMGAGYPESAVRGVTWTLETRGPTARQRPRDGGPAPRAWMTAAGLSFNGGQYPYAIYDPTNGTVSFGRIIRSNKGQIN